MLLRQGLRDRRLGEDLEWVEDRYRQVALSEDEADLGAATYYHLGTHRDQVIRHASKEETPVYEVASLDALVYGLHDVHLPLRRGFEYLYPDLAICRLIEATPNGPIRRQEARPLRLGESRPRLRGGEPDHVEYGYPELPLELVYKVVGGVAWDDYEVCAGLLQPLPGSDELGHGARPRPDDGRCPVGHLRVAVDYDAWVVPVPLRGRRLYYPEVEVGGGLRPHSSEYSYDLLRQGGTLMKEGVGKINACPSP